MIDRKLYRCDEPGCSKAFLTELALRGHRSAHSVGVAT